MWFVGLDGSHQAAGNEICGRFLDLNSGHAKERLNQRGWDAVLRCGQPGRSDRMFDLACLPALNGASHALVQ